MPIKLIPATIMPSPLPPSEAMDSDDFCYIFFLTELNKTPHATFTFMVLKQNQTQPAIIKQNYLHKLGGKILSSYEKWSADRMTVSLSHLFVMTKLFLSKEANVTILSCCTL